MHRFSIAVLFLLGLAGCGGGGIQEGMPSNVSAGLTPEQQKEHDELIAKEEAAAKALGKNRH
jgi:hypothetical protein